MVSQQKFLSLWKIWQTSDNTTSGDGDIENGDGISHRKEGGLKLEFNWEKQPNNTSIANLFNKYIYIDMYRLVLL